LILILPPIIVLISFGWFSIFDKLSKRYQPFFLIMVGLLYLVSYVFYSHRYFVDYRLVSEKWWHNGWGAAIHEIKSIDKDYDRVIISMSGEPAWIFFAGHYEYPPNLWQKDFPIGNDTNVDGFGKISHTGKFYFGSPTSDVQIYGLGQYLNSRTLYLANASEVGNDLIMHPEGVPPGLRLIKTVPFLSGKPAFYLFSGIKQ